MFLFTETFGCKAVLVPRKQNYFIQSLCKFWKKTYFL